jgi:hypothetical protein
MRGQTRGGRQVEPAVAEHVEELRVVARGPGGRDAEVGLEVRELEHFDAVDVHGRFRLARVKAPRIDLGDVGDDVGLDSPGLAVEV